MKFKILITSLALFFVFNAANAEIVFNYKKPFVLNFDGAYEIKNTDKTIFKNNISEINNNQIVNWKIRFYCDKKMSLSLNDDKNNSCGKAINIPNLSQNKNFYFVFDNNDPIQKKFSYKLKAYNKNGKWIHTETRNFSWK